MKEVKLSENQLFQLKISQCALKEFVRRLSSPAPARPSKVIKHLLRDAVEIQEPKNIKGERRVFVYDDWRFILDNDLSDVITCSRLSLSGCGANNKRGHQRARVKRETQKIIKEG